MSQDDDEKEAHRQWSWRRYQTAVGRGALGVGFGGSNNVFAPPRDTRGLVDSRKPTLEHPDFPTIGGMQAPKTYSNLLRKK
jgi:hypothetical protein